MDTDGLLGKLASAVDWDSAEGLAEATRLLSELTEKAATDFGDPVRHELEAELFRKLEQVSPHILSEFVEASAGGINPTLDRHVLSILTRRTETRDAASAQLVEACCRALAISRFPDVLNSTSLYLSGNNPEALLRFIRRVPGAEIELSTVQDAIESDNETHKAAGLALAVFCKDANVSPILIELARSSEPRMLRAMAIIALSGRTGDDAVRAFLLRELKAEPERVSSGIGKVTSAMRAAIYGRSDLRSEAAEACAGTTDRRLKEHLLRGLGSSDPAFALSCAKGLRDANDPEVWRALLRTIFTAGARSALSLQCAESLQGCSDPDVIRMLTLQLEEEAFPHSITAAIALRGTKDSTARSTLIQILNDSNGPDDLRLACARSLSCEELPEIRSALRACLVDSEELALTCIAGLGAPRDEDEISSYVEALRHESEEVAAASARMLNRCGIEGAFGELHATGFPRQAQGRLEKNLGNLLMQLPPEDSHKVLRAFPANVSAETVELLEPFLEHKDARLRICAAAAIGPRHARAARLLFEGLNEDTDGAVFCARSLGAHFSASR